MRSGFAGHSYAGAWLIAVLATASLSGCGGKETEISQAVEEFLPLQTRAIALREARFELADSIRFAQSRLMAMPADAPERAHVEGQIEEFLMRKEQLVARSLALADTVNHSVRHILDNVCRNDADKQTFYNKLNAELKMRGFPVDESTG